MQVVLHIGTDKTGSTSIQNTAWLNREWLLDRYICLPTTGLGRGNGHANLLRKLDSGNLQRLAAELRLASEQGCERALLSWEGMGSLQFGGSQIRQLGAALAGFEVHVLVYLREQADIIQSGHLQRVKRYSNTLDISAMEHPRNPAERLRALIALRNPNRNYYRLLRRWQKAIPRVTFSVRIFERSQLLRGDVIQDFLSQLGVEIDESFVHARKNHNPSLDVEGALVLESLQKKHPNSADMEVLLDLTESVISREGASTKYFLSQRAVAKVRQYFWRSNRKLARRFMAGKDDPFPCPGECWRSESLDVIQSRAALLLEKVEQLRQVPTLMGQVAGEAIASRVDLSPGWGQVASWGAWSTARESRIRFRVYRHRLIQEVASVQLKIEGRYYGNNTNTRVSVNGADFGELVLLPGRSMVEIPVGALLDNELVEIVLEHQQPVSPAALEGKGDERTLAFGIERLAYTLVRRHDG